MPTPSLHLRDRQVLAFKLVMEIGTVSGAARRMLIAQPGVTRLLKQLEHDVGFILFERVRGRLVPTPEAYLFHREVQRVWSGMDHLRDTARRISGREVGGLRISAMPLLGITFLPDILAEFAPQHSEARLELTTFRSEQVVEDVITQRCDVGFAIIPSHDKRVNSEIFHLESLCALPNDHPLVKREIIEVKDLMDQTLICFEPQDPLRLDLERLMEAQQIRPRYRLEVSLALQAVRLVKRGVGISIIDPISATAFDNKDIIMRPFLPVIGESFALLTSKDQPLSQLAKDFIELFNQRFKEAQY